jgi:outer membrane receptor protein involved in Fe transport
MYHNSRSYCRALGLAAFLWCASCTLMFGQAATASGSLSGTVTDSTGAVISGATVTVASAATSITRTTSTSGTGNYRFDSLLPGVYSVRATKSGFATATAQAVELQISNTTTQNFTLKPGAETQIVEVTAEAPLVNQEKTSIGLEIVSRQIENLPLNGRNFENLAYLAPGAKATAPWDPTKARVAGVGINGSNGRNMNITINGVDDKDNTVGGPVMQLPLEAVQEFNISTNRFSAANGRSSGSAVNVITRSGTNEFHGSAYIFDTQTALNANDKLNADGGNPTPQFERQQFGGRFGAPLIKDKTFGFVAVERLREHTSIPVLPQAFTELSLVQNLNLGNITLNAQPASTIPTPYFDWRYNARIDHNFSSKHRAFISYSAQTNKDLNDQSGNANDLSEGNFQNNQLIATNFTLNSVLSPRFVNSFTAGFQYWNNLIASKIAAPLVTFPHSISFGTNTNVPQQSYQRKYQFRDDMTFTTGNHGMKFGVDFLWEPSLGGFFEFNSTLELDFQDLPSAILSNKTLYPQGFSTPGAVTGMSISLGDPNEDLPGGAKMLGLYFQDTWKATRRLTLDLGLRYDRDFNLFASNAQAGSRTYQLLKAINSPFAGIPHDDTRDFSPRVGFAYDLTGKGNNILRGGYGLYYDQVFLNIPLFMIQQTHATLFATVFSISGTGPTVNSAGVVVPPSCSSCTVPGTAIPLSGYRLGVDPQPTIPAPITSLTSGAVGRLMSPDYRNPYTQQWNIGFAHSFGPSTVLEIDYVHTLGLHEEKREILNYVDQTNGPCTPVFVKGDPNNPGCRSGVRVLHDALAAAGQPQIARISMETPWGRSRYDGMNVSLRHRLTHHFSVNAGYTLSRGLAYNGNAASYSNTVTDPRQPLLPSDFGPVPNDERHHFSIGSFIQLPWGFEVAPVLQVGSARPYAATNGVSNVLGFGTGPAAAHAIVQTSDPKNLLWETTQTTAALRNCYLVTGECKQVTWDYLRGQSFFNLDTRLTKVIKFGERKDLKLMFQMFDLTNRANFGNNYDGSLHDFNSDPTKNAFQTPLGYVGCGSNGCNRNIPTSFRGEWGVQFTF